MEKLKHNATESELKSEKSFDILGAFPTLIGIASLAILLITISHEWGYFSVVGPHFQAFVTTADYLTNAILWLPQNVLTVALVFVLAASFAHVTTPKNSKKRNENSGWPLDITL